MSRKSKIRCGGLICLVLVLVLVLLADMANADITTDLVGYWKLDGNANDSSGNNYHGEEFGNPSYVSGVIDQAMEFNGTDQSVYIPDFTAVQNQDAVTVCMWVKADRNTGADQVMWFTDEDGSYGRVRFGINGDEWEWKHGNGAGGANPNVDDGENPIILGEWVHLAGVRKNNDRLELFVNGISVDRTAFGVAGVAEPQASIGSERRSPTSVRDPFDGVIDEVRFYTRALSAGDIKELFMFTGVPPKFASNPNPADEAEDVPRDVTLSWTPGVYAPAVNGHKVYLNESFNDVNDGIGGITHDANNYTPLQLLDFGKTYYWRVDEVNSVSGWDQGEVWSFTVEPFNYPVENIIATASSQFSADEGPENTINRSGLDDSDLHSDDGKAMWLSSMIGPQPTWIQYEFDQVYKLHQMLVWNYNSSVEPIIGFGIKDATIDYSTDGANWTTLATVEFARAPGMPGYAANTTVDLGDAVAKYVKITANSNWGGMVTQYGLSEVRFFHIPVLAREQNPASGSTDMDVDNVTLSWRAGRDAASHEVYLSTEEQAVINESINPVSIPADRSYVSYDTGELELGQSYYWKVNEVNEAETPATWQGDVLNFSTLDYLVVDDIEDYNDFEPDRVFDTWIDGWGVPTNGSQVGSDVPPFAEQTIVHGGNQSMPLRYDNNTASYSEATANVANLKVGPDWTKYGIKALILYFYGDPNNTAQQMYVKLNGVKVTYDGDAESLTRTAWQTWNIDLKDFTGVNLSNITELSIGLERSGAAGGSGVVYIDDIRLYPSRCLPELVKPAVDLNNDCQVNYLDLEIMAGDWLLNDYTLPTTTANPAGLIGHWPFDGSPDDATGNATSDAYGSPSYEAGKIGQAISLDGATQSIAISGFSQIQSVPGLTLAMWAKPDVVSGAHMIWFTDETDSYGKIRCRLNNGNWQWRCGQGISGNNITVSSAATAGEWTHFAGVRSNNDKLELFINGVSKDTEPFALPGPHSDQSSIGAERESPTDISEYFAGLIDDVRVYNYALSAAEAAYLADDSPGDGQLYVPVQSVADLYDAEPVYYRGINFKDYTVLVDGWLDEQLWPAE